MENEQKIEKKQGPKSFGEIKHHPDVDDTPQAIVSNSQS